MNRIIRKFGAIFRWTVSCEWRLLLWVILILALLLAVFGDVYIIITDMWDWIRS